MKCATAPVFGSDIGDGFGEVPMVAVKVPGIVLALAVGLILRCTQDGGSVLSRALTMTLRILDTNLSDMRLLRRHISFGDRKAAFAGPHLDAVIGDAQPDSKAKGF